MTYSNRLLRLQDYLKNSCDALLVEDQLNIFYLTGLTLSAGKLLVHTRGAHLFVDDRYFELCERMSPYPVLKLDHPSFEKRLSSPDFSFIQRLGFDSDTTSVKNFMELEKYVDKAIQSGGDRSISLVPLDNPIKTLRMIKDAGEIALLKEAAALGSEGFDFLCTLLKEGISEVEIAVELEIFWKRRGSKSLGFDPIIAFGANSSMPHYRSGNERLKKGHVVLADIGVNYRHYHSDMTRMIFLGEPDPRIEKIYHIVRDAQKAALDLCRPGTLVADLDSAAREYIASQGYGDRFTHGLGHGVGLEIHELPVLKNISPHKEIVLSPGMVITIEPGIYLPGVGGVRIEDTVVITPEGHDNLTQRSTDLHYIY